jgi:hypothetical protein
MQRHGGVFGVSNPQIVTKGEAAPHVTSGRLIFPRLPFDQAVLLTKS